MAYSRSRTIFLTNLKALRLRQGLSCKQMAKLLNVSVRSIKRMDRGELPLSVDTRILFAIEDTFGIPPRDILSAPPEP